MTHAANTIFNAKHSKRGGTVKKLLSTAAVCLALTAGAVPAYAADEAASAEETMQAAFEQLIADAKTNMVGDPAVALEHAVNAEKVARSATNYANRDLAIATAMWLRGEAEFRSGKPEAAVDVIAEAITLLGSAGANTKLHGDLLLSQGRLASRLSDAKTAVKSFFAAHEVFVGLNAERNEAMALMEIGSIYRDAQAYNRALDYYRRAGEVFPGDVGLNISAFNNQANILKEIERYEEALEFYNQAIAIAEEIESDVLKARILTNVATLYVADGRFPEAENAAQDALAILGDDSNTEWARFAYAALAEAKLEQGDAEAAEGLVAKAFAGLDLETTSLSYEDAHNVAYETYLQRGDYEQALAHHERFKTLSDNAKKVASSANLALLGARFQSSEQKLNIERLRNEKMEQRVELENTKRQTTLQYAVMTVGGVVLLFGAAGFMGMRNHRNRVALMNSTLSTTVDQLNDEIGRREIVERDLIAAKDAAEEASRVKSTFLATMSHELRTPMNGILGFSKILLDDDLNDTQREYVSIIEKSGTSLLDMINDILDLSKIEAGKLELESEPFNLRSTVEDAVQLLQYKAQEKNLNLAVHVDPSIPTLVEGDGDRMRQILVNLVGNAVKFTESGSVAVVASANDTGDAVKLSVIDTGIGIPEGKADTLFQRFSQVDGTLARKYEGTGLGLAICKELVEAMEGEIGVESVYGEGSEFWLTVPLRAADAMTQLPHQARVLEETKRVVVVDDVSANQRVFGLMLPAMNADCVIAANAEDAVDTLRKLKEEGEPVDAIIVSNTLRSASPEDLVARFNRNALCDDAKLVLSSPSSVDAAELEGMGFDGQIDHPITERSVFGELRSLDTARTVGEDATQAVKPACKVVTLAPRPQEAASVLVVEDNLANQQLIAAVLSSFDVEMDIVRNGVEAVENAAEKKYDMILMDVHMPTMNGIEATRRIRRIDGLNAETTIIALTAVARPGDREKFLEAGMDDYLSKPLELQPLRAKINSLLNKVSAEKARARAANDQSAVHDQQA